MGDVIDLASRKYRQGDDSPLASKYARAAMLEAARDTRQPFSADDQERAAKNLHRLLAHLAGERGVSKRAIAEAAGLGGQGVIDSTKRLDAYTLPEGANSLRRERIAKKPSKYFEIARAIGSLTNEPQEPYVCQIFEGCSFGTGIAVEKDWDEHRWARLAELLRRMSAAVIAKENLTRYWTQARRINGEYLSQEGRIRYGFNALDFVGSSNGLAGYRAFPDELPPVPSVLLGERPMVASQVAVISLRDGRQIEATFSLLLEARIALAPINADGAVGPMIEFRSRMDARSASLGDIIFDNRYSDGSGGSDTISRAWIDGKWLDIAEFPVLEVVEAEYRHGCEHVYFSWEEVSPALLRSLFGDEVRPFDMVYRTGVSCYGDFPPSRFEFGLPAFYLNAHLLSGALEAELAEACRQCAEILEEYCTELDLRVADAESAAERRWAQD